MSNDYNTNFSNRLDMLAQSLANGIKADFARSLEISPQALNKYLKGERNPGLEMLSKICQLGVNMDWLIRGTGNPYNPDVLPHDTQWKRLYIVKAKSSLFRNMEVDVPEMLNVDVDTFNKWIIGLESIPDFVVDKIYDQIKSFINKAWWYKGDGNPGNLYFKSTESTKFTSGEISILEGAISKINHNCDDLSTTAYLNLIITVLRKHNISISTIV